MTRVDELYADLKLLISEHEMFNKAVEENKRLKDAIKDIRAEIEKSISENPKAKNDYTQGLNDGMCHALHIISKHIGGAK